MISVVYPGTFDPPHLGHLDIVRRSCEIFDRVVVAIAKSPRKNLLFNLEERVDMFRVMVEPLGAKVEVKGFDGLLVDFMKKEGLRVIVRGVSFLRTLSMNFRLPSITESWQAWKQYL